MGCLTPEVTLDSGPPKSCAALRGSAETLMRAPFKIGVGHLSLHRAAPENEGFLERTGGAGFRSCIRGSTRAGAGAAEEEHKPQTHPKAVC